MTSFKTKEQFDELSAKRNRDLPAPPPGGKYAKGETAFCTQNGKMWEAKVRLASPAPGHFSPACLALPPLTDSVPRPLLRQILDVRLTASGKPNYFVHYNGWASQWDEWLPEERMHKFDYEAYKKLKAQQLRRERRAKNDPSRRDRKRKAPVVEDDDDAGAGSGSDAAAGGAGAGGSGDAAGPTRKRPRTMAASAGAALGSSAGAAGRGVGDEAGGGEHVPGALGDGSAGVSLVHVTLPHTLKLFLIRDEEQICTERKLLPLPRIPCVTTVLRSFAEHESLVGRGDGDSIEKLDILDGLRTYFNKALGMLLLHRFERPQYVSLRESFARVQVADVYGCEHLLRLLVRLPELFEGVALTDEAAACFQAVIADLIRYISANPQFLLLSYERCSPEYLRMASI